MLHINSLPNKTAQEIDNAILLQDFYHSCIATGAKALMLKYYQNRKEQIDGPDYRIFTYITQYLSGVMLWGNHVDELYILIDKDGNVIF